MALGGSSGGGARGIEAGRAFVRLGAKDDLSAKLKQIAGRFADFGKRVLALTGVGGVLAGVLGGLSLKDTLGDLDKMTDVAKAFGITGKAASGLFGVLGAVGGEFKENLEGIIQFSGTMEKAMQGVGQGAELFAGMAVTAKELEGLSVDEQFYRVHAAIRELPQPLQEAKLALLGGSDSMKQWQRLLSMSSDEVRQMAGDLSMATVELEEASAAAKAMAAAQAAVGRIWQQVVILLAPKITELAKQTLEALKPVVEWMRGRTLTDVLEEAKALFNVAWTEVGAFARETWRGVLDFFTSGWDAAVLLVKDLLAGLGRFAADTISKAITGPLDAAAGLDFTGTAASASAAIKLANAAAKGVFDGVARDAAKEFDAREAARAGGRKGLADELNAMRQAARDNLDAVRAGIEANRQRRLLEEKPPERRLPQLAQRVTSSLGTFGAGSFLRQGFGVQSASQDVGKKIDKTNGLLGKIQDQLAQAGPLVATA